MKLLGSTGGAQNDVIANIGALFVGIAIQLGSVPLLLGALGRREYGLWLLLSAVPSLLAVSDLGLAGAGATEASALWARGQTDDARRLFMSYRRRVRSVVALIVFAAILVTGGVFALSPLIASEFLVIVILAVWVVPGVEASVLEGGFRISGHFTRGVLLLSALRLAEAAAMVACAYWTHNFVAMSLALLVVRTFGIAVMQASLTIKLGRAQKPARAMPLRHLLTPSLASLLLPASALAASQGVILAAAAVLPLVAVPALNAVRLLAGLVRQFVQALNLGGLPAMTRYAAVDNTAALDQVSRSLRLFTMASVVIAVAAAAAFGRQVIEIWTGLHVGTAACTLFVAAVAVEVSWFPAIVLRYATNTHIRLSVVLLGGTLTACAFAATGGALHGVVGFSAGYLIAELAVAAAIGVTLTRRSSKRVRPPSRLGAST